MRFGIDGSTVSAEAHARLPHEPDSEVRRGEAPRLQTRRRRQTSRLACVCVFGRGWGGPGYRTSNKYWNGIFSAAVMNTFGMRWRPEIIILGWDDCGVPVQLVARSGLNG